MIHSFRPFPQFTSRLLLAIIVVTCCCLQGDAKFPIGRIVLPAVMPQETVNTQKQGDDDYLFPGAAPLNTSKELQRAMNKAMEAAQKGQHEVAVTFWKRILEKIDSSLMSRKGETSETTRHAYRKYLLARYEVEQAIRNLPPEGLELYREKVDFDASALFKDRLKDQPVSALEKVVDFYFMSSLGDDAAFKLALLYADRGDFSKSAGLLERILNDYPDPSVSKSSVLTLLSLVYSQSGDFERANQTFALAKEVTRSEKILAQVDSAIKQSQATSSQSTFTVGNWNMRHGNKTRRGLMLDPQIEWVSDPLTSLWEHSMGKVEQEVSGLADIAQYPSSPVPVQKYNTGGGFFNVRVAGLSRVAYPTSTTLATLEKVRESSTRWKQIEATPASQLLMSDSLLFFKSDHRLVCCDAITGKIKWMGRPNQLINTPINRYNSGRPPVTSNGAPLQRLSGQHEQFLFGDRISHAMSIAGELLLNIEGKYLGRGGESQVATSAITTSFNRYGTQWRGKTNWLAAYELKTGKLKWHRSAMENTNEESDSKVGFLAAPVPYKNSLLVPVSKQGGVWLHSLNKENGKTEWKITLCDAPMGTVSTYSPVGMSVEGGDVYVATGSGLLFAIDARSGTIRWSIRYQRTGQQPETYDRFRGRTPHPVKGWDEDIIIPYRHMLIVIPSDYQSIFAIDRTAGRILWESPQVPVSGDAPTYYCLGVVDKNLYLASSKVVRCYDLEGGKLEWEELFSGSVGRGFLSQKHLYLPVKNDIVKIDRFTGKELARRGVYTSLDEPLGNLYSNGKNLFVQTPGRVYSATSMKGHLQLLAKRIAAGDPTACWDRMKLRYRMGKLDDAIVDLQTMIQLMQDHRKYDSLSANNKMQLAVSLLKLETVRPILALDLLLEANQRLQKVAVTIPQEQVKHRETLLSVCISQLTKRITADNHQEYVKKIIEITPLCGDTYLLMTTQSALRKVVASSDIPLLLETLKVTSPLQRRLAINVILSKEGLKLQNKENLIPVISPLMKDNNNYVQLAASTFLINQKQRNALGTLIQLLESEEINVRARTIGMLRGISGKNFKYLAYQKPTLASQVNAITAWKKWLTEEGATAKLDFSASHSVELGRTLIVHGSSSSRCQVIELDASGKQTWSVPNPYPGACIGTPNGHRIISSYRSRTIDEYDAAGKKIWTLSGVSGTVTSLQRLPNGNTLVCFSNQVREYSPDKKNVWTYQKRGVYVLSATRLMNGNTLLALHNNKKVAEVDPKGNTVWEMTLPFNSRSAQRLDNGNTLVCNSNARSVHEYTPDKKEVSSMTFTEQTHVAQRLSNGNTFIRNYQGVYEYNPSGKLIWSKSYRNVRAAHRF